MKSVKTFTCKTNNNYILHYVKKFRNNVNRNSFFVPTLIVKVGTVSIYIIYKFSNVKTSYSNPVPPSYSTYHKTTNPTVSAERTHLYCNAERALSCCLMRWRQWVTSLMPPDQSGVTSSAKCIICLLSAHNNTLSADYLRQGHGYQHLSLSTSPHHRIASWRHFLPPRRRRLLPSKPGWTFKSYQFVLPDG